MNELHGHFGGTQFFPFFFVPFIGVGSLFITRGPSCKAVLLPQNFPSPAIKEVVYIALVETRKNMLKKGELIVSGKVYCDKYLCLQYVMIYMF